MCDKKTVNTDENIKEQKHLECKTVHEGHSHIKDEQIEFMKKEHNKESCADEASCYQEIKVAKNNYNEC